MAALALEIFIRVRQIRVQRLKLHKDGEKKFSPFLKYC